MKEARKKGRAEVQTVRNALTKMGGHREGVASRALGAGDADARRTQEEVDAASIREGVGGPGAGAECSLVRRAVGVDAVDDGARGDARRRAVGGRWVPRSLAHRADAYGAQDGPACGSAEREGRVLGAASALGVVARVAAPDAGGPTAGARLRRSSRARRCPTRWSPRWKTACRYYQLPLPRRAWTVKDVVLRLAALGGYERRPDRTPGWLVLWRGWRELLRFWRIAHFVENAAPHELPGKPPPDPSWKPRGS